MRVLTVCALLASASAFAGDPQLLRFLMPEAKVVSGVDIERVKSSPFGQFLLSQIPQSDPELEKFIAATGFDPRRDLLEVVMATPGDPAHKTGLAVVRGNFDADRFLALLQGRVEVYQGVRIASAGHALAFIDNTTVLAGDLESVRAAIERRNGANPLDPALAAKVAEISTSQDAWGVSILPLSTLAASVPDRNAGGALQSDLLKAIQQTSGGVRFGENVDLSAEAVTRSEKDATALADVVRFLVSLAQLNAPKGPGAEVVAWLQRLSIATQSNTVKLSLSIPEAELEKLILSAKGRSARRTAAR